MTDGVCGSGACTNNNVHGGTLQGPAIIAFSFRYENQPQIKTGRLYTISAGLSSWGSPVPNADGRPLSSLTP